MDRHIIRCYLSSPSQYEPFANDLRLRFPNGLDISYEQELRGNDSATLLYTFLVTLPPEFGQWLPFAKRMLISSLPITIPGLIHCQPIWNTETPIDDRAFEWLKMHPKLREWKRSAEHYFNAHYGPDVPLHRGYYRDD